MESRLQDGIVLGKMEVLEAIEEMRSAKRVAVVGSPVAAMMKSSTAPMTLPFAGAAPTKPRGATTKSGKRLTATQSSSEYRAAKVSQPKKVGPSPQPSAAQKLKKKSEIAQYRVNLMRQWWQTSNKKN